MSLIYSLFICNNYNLFFLITEQFLMDHKYPKELQIARKVLRKEDEAVKKDGGIVN